MKTRIKAAFYTTKNYIETNKVAICMTGVAIGAVALQQRNRKEFDKFLTEKGIDLDEYYCPEAYEEKTAI